MAYTVLARKYRPQTFEDLAGQEYVTRTLGNAITTGRVAHAFLFTGVRGVGKTTSARILAKALNCEKGPTPSPCNQCDPCREITSGVDIDVLEIDGASNNSVDDVRRLQESIPFRPSRDRFKIFIVDEVHMLSTGAFNAFLKTLEEPPAHVKFIFATTESHKVPVTIRSRCQRYDFRLIPQSVVSKRVREILVAEKIEADDAAVSIVAREAAGSMRDALTLLDQLVAIQEGPLRGADIARSLGIADRTLVFELARHVLSGDGASVLRTIDRAAKQGLDTLHLSRQLTELARDLVVLIVAPEDQELVELVDEERTEAIAIAKSVELLELERTFAAMTKLVDEVARTNGPRTAFEMGLLRIATRPPLRALSEIVARLEEIERRGGGGGGGGGVNAPRGGGGGARSGPPSAPERAIAEPPRAETRPVATTAAGTATAPQTAPTPPTTPSAPPPSTDAWERIVASLRDAKPALGAIILHGVCVAASPEKIVLAFPEGSFFGQQVQAKDARDSLADAAALVFGARPQIDITFSAQATASGRSVAQIEQARLEDKRESQRRTALSHPRVIEAMQIFPESAGKVEVQVDIDGGPSKG